MNLIGIRNIPHNVSLPDLVHVVYLIMEIRRDQRIYAIHTSTIWDAVKAEKKEIRDEYSWFGRDKHRTFNLLLGRENSEGLSVRTMKTWGYETDRTYCSLGTMEWRTLTRYMKLAKPRKSRKKKTTKRIDRTPKLSHLSYKQINSLHLENITGFEKLDLEFDKVNIIYGVDGSGKSTIKECLELLTTGKRAGRDKKSLLRVGKINGRIEAGINIDGNSRKLEQIITSGAFSNKGMSQQKLLSELGVTKPALELLSDVWQVLRKSEKDMGIAIQRALSKNLTRDEVIEAIVEYTPEEHRVRARELLQDEIKKATSDTMATALKKMKALTKNNIGRLPTIEAEQKVLAEKLEQLKNVNLDMVKKARVKIEAQNTITDREKEITTIQKDIDEDQKPEKTLLEKKLEKKTDLTQLKAEIISMNAQIKSKQDEKTTIPTDVDTEGKLPCRWFTLCKLDEEHIIKLVKAQTQSNKEKKSSLDLEIKELQKQIKVKTDEQNSANVVNAGIEANETQIKNLASQIEGQEANIKRIQSLIDDLKKTIPEVDDAIGDALFTLADEAEEMKEKDKNLADEASAIAKDSPVILALETAITSADSDLKATKTDEFIKQMKSDLVLTFGSDVTYSELEGFRIGDLPHTYLSMSQMQRVGIGLQHSAATVTGVKIMLIDDMNIITDYSRIGKLLTDAVKEDGVQLFLFSSIRGVHEYIKAEAKIIDLAAL